MDQLERVLKSQGFERSGLPRKGLGEWKCPTTIWMSSYAVVVAATLPKGLNVSSFEDISAFYQEGVIAPLLGDHPSPYPEGHLYLFHEGRPENAALQEAIWDMERSTAVCVKTMVYTEDGRWDTAESCDFYAERPYDFLIPFDKAGLSSVELDGQEIPLDTDILLFFNDGAEEHTSVRLQDRLETYVWVPFPRDACVDDGKDGLQFLKWLYRLRSFALDSGQESKFYLPVRHRSNVRLIQERFHTAGLSVRTVIAKRGVNSIRIGQQIFGQ